MTKLEEPMSKRPKTTPECRLCDALSRLWNEGRPMDERMRALAQAVTILPALDEKEREEERIHEAEHAEHWRAVARTLNARRRGRPPKWLGRARALVAS